MINIEELRTDIEAGTLGDWLLRHIEAPAMLRDEDNAKAFEVVSEDGDLVCNNEELYPQAVPIEDMRRIARLPQLEREYLAMREALEFYAKHHANPNDGPWGAESTDFGDVARKALGETQ